MFDIISQWETNEWTAIKQTPLASIRLITILYVLLFIVCLFMFIYKSTNKWHFYIFEVNFPMNGVEAHSKFPYGLHSIDSTVHSIERRSINKLDNLLCRLSLVRSTVGEYGGFYHPAHLSGVCLCWGGKCREANKRSQGAKRATPRIIEKHIKCCDNNTAQTLNILQRCFLLSVAIHIKCSFADSLLVF